MISSLSSPTTVSSAFTPKTAWSPTSVLRAIRDPRGLVSLSYTGYFPRLFDDDLITKIEHPSEMNFDPEAVAPPCRMQYGNTMYFVPGSLQDLHRYISCVVACYEVIRTAWQESGNFEDRGPPSIIELEQGLLGGAPWKDYWNDMHSQLNTLVTTGYPWMLNADIEACATSIDPSVLASLLAECGADPDVVRIFAGLHQSWSRFGFPGLPILGPFSLLTRVYLLDVEQSLRSRGFVFLRVVDDFRVLCRAAEEKELALSALREALALRSLKLNEAKSMFYRMGDFKPILQRRLLTLKRKVKSGVVRPTLVRGVKWPVVRPFALAMLSLVNRVQRAGR